MKSHWTIAIYGSVLVLNALMVWAVKTPAYWLFGCWIAIITLCAFRILTEFLDWRQ